MHHLRHTNDQTLISIALHTVSSVEFSVLILTCVVQCHSVQCTLEFSELILSCPELTMMNHKSHLQTQIHSLVLAVPRPNSRYTQSPENRRENQYFGGNPQGCWSVTRWWLRTCRLEGYRHLQSTFNIEDGDGKSCGTERSSVFVAAFNPLRTEDARKLKLLPNAC